MGWASAGLAPDAKETVITAVLLCADGTCSGFNYISSAFSHSFTLCCLSSFRSLFCLSLYLSSLFLPFLAPLSSHCRCRFFFSQVFFPPLPPFFFFSLSCGPCFQGDHMCLVAQLALRPHSSCVQMHIPGRALPRGRDMCSTGEGGRRRGRESGRRRERGTRSFSVVQARWSCCCCCSRLCFNLS